MALIRMWLACSTDVLVSLYTKLLRRQNEQAQQPSEVCWLLPSRSTKLTTPLICNPSPRAALCQPLLSVLRTPILKLSRFAEAL